MKRYAALLMLLSFGLACKKEPAQSPQGAELLPLWGEQIQSMVLASNDAKWIDVVFEGPVLHVTAGPSRRAVLPRNLRSGHPHTAYLTVPSANVKISDFESVFGSGACKTADGRPSAECRAKLSGVGLRIVDAEGSSILGFDKSHPSFRDVAQHMKPTGRERDFLENLHDDVYKEIPPTTGPVAAYFDLDRGGFKAVAFSGCPSRFEGDSQYRRFAEKSILRLIFRNPAVLQAKTAALDWKPIELKGLYASLTVSNVSDHGRGSHHDIFGELSADGFKNLPNVEKEPGCIEPSGGIPGCGNDQWP